MYKKIDDRLFDNIARSLIKSIALKASVVMGLNFKLSNNL